MQSYISLLRGINVSGQKKIKMTELAALYHSLKLQEVKTYIQSGNVVFQSDNKSLEELTKDIEQGIKQKFSFDVPVIVLTSSELTYALKKLPFKNINVANDGGKIMFSFLSELPTQATIEMLMSYVKAPESLIIENKVIYLHCPNGYGKTKLSNNFIENKLKLTATTRNLKTVIKLLELV